MILRKTIAIRNHVVQREYYNFYHDTLNFRTIEIISSSQQTDITNDIADTNTQTTHCTGDNYLNNKKSQLSC